MMMERRQLKLPSFQLKKSSAARIIEYDDRPLLLKPGYNNYGEELRQNQKQIQTAFTNNLSISSRNKNMTPLPSPFNKTPFTSRQYNQFKSLNNHTSLPKIQNNLFIRQNHKTTNADYNQYQEYRQGEQGQQNQSQNQNYNQNYNQNKNQSQNQITNSNLNQIQNLPNIRDNQILNIKFSFLMKTKAGCTFNKVQKTNQDFPICNPKCLDKFGVQFFAVCDGHGVNGHHVSSFLGKNLPKNLLKQLNTVKWQKNEIYASLMSAFVQTNQELMLADFDTNLSGSTTISILIHESKIYCANVGDSRAIVCSKDDKSKWSSKALNIDHKPDYQKERQRIIKCGGRIEVHRDDEGNALGPERVWLRNIDAPGLAMTRSFGDKVGIQAGIIAEPEIFDYEIDPTNKFIIVASDGVFEFLSNVQVMSQVIQCYEKNNLTQACDKIINLSTLSWQRESVVRDDITCIVIFLH